MFRRSRTEPYGLWRANAQMALTMTSLQVFHCTPIGKQESVDFCMLL